MRTVILQAETAGLTPNDRLDLLAAAVFEVRADAGARADLVVCPELFLSGYSPAAAEMAESRRGPFAQAVAGIARSAGTAIVYGFPEADQGLLYNSALCVDATGVVVAHQRKLAIPPGFEVDLFTAGDGFTVFDLCGMRCAILICYDVEFPEAARAAAVAGAEVLIVPTALGAEWGVVAHRVIPARAFENGVYVLYANHAGAEGHIRFLGASCIIGPDGIDQARAGAGSEIITATLDPASVTAAQKRLPYHRDVGPLRPRLHPHA